MIATLAGALVAGATEELGRLVFERALQDQPGAEAGDPIHGVDVAVDPARTPSSSRRSRSLGATLAMRAYLQKLRLVGQSGGYARLTFPRALGRHRKEAK